MKQRYLIVFDGDAWFIRRVKYTEHDLENNHKVYHCDEPVGTSYKTIDEAVAIVKEKIGL